MTKRLLALAVVPFLLVATSCAKEEATPTRESDEAKAEAVLLIKTDFPESWVATPAGDTDDEDLGPDETSKKLAECIGVPAAALDSLAYIASVQSDSFSDEGGNMTADSQVDTKKSSKEPKDLIAKFKTDKGTKCVEDLFDEILQESISSLSGAQLATNLIDIPGVAESKDMFAKRLEATVAFQGKQETRYLDLVYIAKGRAEVSFLAGSTKVDPFPAQLESELVKTLQDRAKKQFG